MGDDTSPPPNAEPKCEKCAGTTALLSFIPRFGDRPAYRIFECDACKALTWVAEMVSE
jgi:hypothetical protein